MLRKVKLYGALKDFVGHSELEAHVNSAGEAVRFLLCNWPELESHMAKQYYKVIVGSEELTLDNLNNPSGVQDIKIVPVFIGAGGGGGVGRVLLGATLIAGAFLFPGSSLVFGKAFFGASTVTGSLAAAGMMTKLAVMAGAGLMLSGVSSMLTPVPEVPEYESESDPRLSFSFSGVQNTSRAGTPIPICYGEIITGSVQISLGVDTEQVRV